MAKQDEMKAPVIQKGIPIPLFNDRGSARELLQKMDVGDSVVVPSQRCYCFMDAAKILGLEVVSRRESISERRIWLKSKTRDMKLKKTRNRRYED